MKVVTSFAAVRREVSGSIGLVPTMGFLHEGHTSLIEAAAAKHDSVVVSIFVNPRQFGDQGDLASYPRELDRDVAIAEESGATVVFAPDVADVYGPSHATTVVVSGVTEGMEGEHRPGHFDGVATVVAVLFAGTRPDVAYFGRKDAQQLAVVRTLARDLPFDVRVQGLPIIREESGLALSSRNVRLPKDRRSKAIEISQALFSAADAFDSGERSSLALTGIVRRSLSGEGVDAEGVGIDPSVEYVAVADAASAAPVDEVASLAFLAVAADVGGVRLIDNVFLDPRSGKADRGTTLVSPSVLYGGR